MSSTFVESDFSSHATWTPSYGPPCRESIHSNLVRLVMLNLLPFAYLFCPYAYVRMTPYRSEFPMATGNQRLHPDQDYRIIDILRPNIHMHHR